MKKMFKKENLLIVLSMIIFLYALFLNIFYPLPKTLKKDYSSKKEEAGIKADFKNAVNEYISSDVSGLAFGYLLGEKDELPSGVESKMKTVGMAHIIVVSGTHLSIIIGFSRKLFGKISRFSAVYFSLFLLLVYAILIGFTPSIIRASFVAILSLFAWFFGRVQRANRTVMITAGFCLLINPYFLTNVSFQLSMLAYSGVVLIMPIMTRYFYGRDRPGFIGSTILSSLSAIISCLPIQLYYFGSVNLIAILANLLILPTIPYAMGLSFLTGVLSMFKLDFIALGVGKIAELILKYHIKIISILEDKSEFLFEFQKNEPLWLLIYIPIIVLVVISVRKQNIEICDYDAGSKNKSAVLVHEVCNVCPERIDFKKMTNDTRTKSDDNNRKNSRAKNAKNNRGPIFLRE